MPFAQPTTIPGIVHNGVVIPQTDAVLWEGSHIGHANKVSRGEQDALKLS